MKTKKIFAAALVFALTLSCACSRQDSVAETTSVSSGTLGTYSSQSEEASTNEISADTEQSTAYDPKNETSILTEASDTSVSSETEEEALQTQAPVTESAGDAPDSYREYGENGILIIGRSGHYMGLMGCWGTYELCDNYVSQVNYAASALDGVNVYSMVIPTSVEFYLPDDVTGFTASQKDKIDYIASSLNGVTDIDVYSTLDAHKDEHIYSRTDHHWQPLGAYYAARVFAETIGESESFADLSEYKEVTINGYMGSFYNYSKSLALYNDPEPFTMYISPNDSALKTTYYDTSFNNGYESDLFVSRDAGAYYCSFLGSDDRIAKIETDADNGRTLVICKESYGNALVPFLTECFEMIYVLDLRYFDLNLIDFCNDVGATDLLFATCTFTPAGVNCSKLNDIIY